MIIETALILNLNYDPMLLKPDPIAISQNKFEQAEKQDEKTEAYFRELIKIMDEKMINEIQKPIQ